MTPEEKAIHLFDKYYFGPSLGLWDRSKQCALIAVGEILEVACPDTFACKSYTGNFYSDQEYFEEVRKEIQRL